MIGTHRLWGHTEDYETTKNIMVHIGIMGANRKLWVHKEIMRSYRKLWWFITQWRIWGHIRDYWGH